MLATHARRGELTVYAGAGVSAADPTLLPGASRLAELIFDRLAPHVDLTAVPRSDLIAVADAVSALPQGDRLLRQTILDVADLKGAPESSAHEVLGLLLCEGAATILETNYDDCIERGAQPERPTVVCTASELLQASGPALLKAHGCATQPETMLITSAELAAAPRWATSQAAARMRQHPVVFLGIGSVADYVKSTVKELCEEVGIGHLLVVDPAMAGWDTQDLAWKALLPELLPDQRDARTAEEFCDALMRAYVGHFLQQAAEAVQAMDAGHPQRRGVEALLNSFEHRCATWVLRWLREASLRAPVGTAVVGSAQSIKGALAIGALAGDRTTVESMRSGLVRMVSEADGAVAAVLLLMAFDTTLGSVAAAEARRRVARARGMDLLQAGADAVVVVVGHMGPMSTELTVAPGFRISDALAAMAGGPNPLPDDVVATANPQHIVNGAASGSVWLISGERLIEAA